MDTINGSGYSAQVELHLQLNGSRVALSHVGPDMLTIAPQTEGTLIVKIDDFEKRQTVVLYDGATPNSTEVGFRRCPERDRS
jgi:hypothetical protein